MRLLATLLLLLPTLAMADECRYQAERNLDLPLAGIRTVEIELHSHDLQLHPGKGAGLVLRGRACAADPDTLQQLVVSQHREGDRLVIEAGTPNGGLSWGGDSHQAELRLDLALPAALPVVLHVGSGDAHVQGMRQLRGQVGSGDLDGRDLGTAELSVGSGDIRLSQLDALVVGTVGSGDVKVDSVRGDVRIGTIGSGDVVVRQVQGSVRADTLGSGDLDVRQVHGDLSVGAVGSGDVSHGDIGGRVQLPRDDD